MLFESRSYRDEFIYLSEMTDNFRISFSVHASFGTFLEFIRLIELLLRRAKKSTDKCSSETPFRSTKPALNNIIYLRVTLCVLSVTLWPPSGHNVTQRKHNVPQCSFLTTD